MRKGNFLDREKLLAKEQLQIVKVDLKDGDYVYVTEMTAADQNKFQQSMLKVDVDTSKGDVKKEDVKTTTNLDGYKCKLVALTICDEKGVKLLKFEDWTALAESMSAKTLDRIVAKAQELNKISEEDKEELIKN